MKKDRKDDIRIDLLIVLLYLVIVVFAFLCIRYRIEIMLMWGFPIILICAVSSVFLNYIYSVIKGSREAKKTTRDAEGEEK